MPHQRYLKIMGFAREKKLEFTNKEDLLKILEFMNRGRMTTRSNYTLYKRSSFQ